MSDDLPRSGGAGKGELSEGGAKLPPTEGEGRVSLSGGRAAVLTGDLPPTDGPGSVPLSISPGQAALLADDRPVAGGPEGGAAAITVQVVTRIIRSTETGAVDIEVAIRGLTADQADAVWRDHVEPMTRQFLRHPGGSG